MTPRRWLLVPAVLFWIVHPVVDLQARILMLGQTLALGARYLGLIVWPVGFTILHDVAWITPPVAVGAVLGLLAGLVALRSASYAVWVAVAWVVLPIVARGLVIAPGRLTEHHTYGAFMPVWIGLAWVLTMARAWLTELYRRRLACLSS